MQHGCCCNQKVAILHPRRVCKELEWAKKGAKWCTVALAGKFQPHQVDKCSKWALSTPPNMFLGQPCSLGAGQHKPILQSCKELENKGCLTLACHGIKCNVCQLLCTGLIQSRGGLPCSVACTLARWQKHKIQGKDICVWAGFCPARCDGYL